MAQHIRISQGLEVFESSYNSDGARTASTPLERTRPLHTDQLCNKILVKPPTDLENDAFAILLGTAALTTTPAGIVTASRPMGGSGHATITGLIAFDAIFTGLPYTTSEIENDDAVDRTATGVISGENTDGTTVYFKVPFAVHNAGDVCAVRLAFAARLTALTKIWINFDQFSQKAQVEIITVAESS